MTVTCTASTIAHSIRRTHYSTRVPVDPISRTNSLLETSATRSALGPTRIPALQTETFLDAPLTKTLPWPPSIARTRKSIPPPTFANAVWLTSSLEVHDDGGCQLPTLPACREPTSNVCRGNDRLLDYKHSSPRRVERARRTTTTASSVKLLNEKRSTVVSYGLKADPTRLCISTTLGPTADPRKAENSPCIDLVVLAGASSWTERLHGPGPEHVEEQGPARRGTRRMGLKNWGPKATESALAAFVDKFSA
ncbi:hypothetical protein HMN09_00290500 [Mycena chlorophos]|uniref:Uncharacterized protein n=1 Tax=Mycena chlorophos TaxID=658473 RepID=A0A8H6TIR1_MYCCL|nr:hypothetical protein HMN09_00290500 [Mycena chlorophos]